MNDVIPVWNLAFLQSHRKRFSMLVCLLTSKLFWIPVSGHWDDRRRHWDDKNRALGSSGLKLQCLYSCDLYSIAE
ncbi:hypothetical protein OZD61_04045 [Wolbachia endosymbiont of Drosophila bocki]|uniref:hypothetical protein n=1 Tax=unclassified Wolbachia TaxID=2640676 RepID=UPI0023A9273F|nr:hypothetical protein [Wolbachia endosymbiont of Drosophila bocki]MDE5057942.1 hypothetical protein [Wolbachia endosymbiont of Drosophila bocki]